MPHFSTWAASNQKRELKALAEKYSEQLRSAKILQADIKKAIESKNKKELEALRKLTVESAKALQEENKKYHARGPIKEFWERFEVEKKRLLDEAKKDYDEFLKSVTLEENQLETAVNESLRDGNPGNISAAGVETFKELTNTIDKAIAKIKD